MKRIALIALVAIILQCIGLTAYAEGGNSHPFKAITENSINYIKKVERNPKLQSDKALFRDFHQRQVSLLNELCRTKIPASIDAKTGFELISNHGEIVQANEAGLYREKVEIYINFELKIANTEKAFANNKLMAVFYNEKGNAVFSEALQEDIDLIELVDTVPAASVSNPYKIGDKLSRKLGFVYKIYAAKLYTNVKKVVIKTADYNLIWKLRKTNEAQEKKEQTRVKYLLKR